MNRLLLTACAITLPLVSTFTAGPASALSMQDCSAKYKAAQQANTLNGMKWNDFRKAQCGAEAEPAAATVPNPMNKDTPKEAAKPAPAPAPAPTAAKPAPAPAPTTTAAKPEPAAKPAETGSTVFPKVVDPKYANESPGKARMKTCVDQYNANKANGANGNLKWIEKGGGYYSECNKQLKG